jgi:hypothetical protein
LADSAEISRRFYDLMSEWSYACGRSFTNFSPVMSCSHRSGDSTTFFVPVDGHFWNDRSIKNPHRRNWQQATAMFQKTGCQLT